MVSFDCTELSLDGRGSELDQYKMLTNTNTNKNPDTNTFDFNRGWASQEG